MITKNALSLCPGCHHEIQAHSKNGCYKIPCNCTYTMLEASLQINYNELRQAAQTLVDDYGGEFEEESLEKLSALLKASHNEKC